MTGMAYGGPAESAEGFNFYVQKRDNSCRNVARRETLELSFVTYTSGVLMFAKRLIGIHSTAPDCYHCCYFVACYTDYSVKMAYGGDIANKRNFESIIKKYRYDKCD